MPEMLQSVGRRFRVSHCVEKICDTAGGSYWSRRMRGTVKLEDLRCDGSAHGGCQAGAVSTGKKNGCVLLVVETGQMPSPEDYGVPVSLGADQGSLPKRHSAYG
jgi:hypothetical protein